MVMDVERNVNGKGNGNGNGLHSNETLDPYPLSTPATPVHNIGSLDETQSTLKRYFEKYWF